MSEKASKSRFLKPEKLQNHTNEGKERRRRKRKATVALLVFVTATLNIVFGRKKLLDGKGTFDDNVFKNLATYIQLKICYYFRSRKC